MKRIITGLVLFPIGIFVLLDGGNFLALFLAISGVLAFYEVSVFSKSSKMLLLINCFLYILLGFLFFYLEDFTGYRYLLIPLVTIFYVISIIDFYQMRIFLHGNKLLLWLRFFLYISCGFLSVLLVRGMDNGIFYIGALFLTIWATDIFAFYGGKMFGSHKLSAISPKKTIEGTLFGFSSAIIIVFIFCYYFNLSMYYVIFAGVFSILGQIGDLYESLIKRFYNIKDSSNLLPGHGGILDRADSTLYVFPFVFLLLELFLL